MIESQVRALFTAIASNEPGTSQVNTQLAHRRGRARLRWRRAGVAGAPIAAAVAVAAVALAVGAAAPHRPNGPVSTGPSAPRQFNVVIPYLSFGWLPPGISMVQGGTGRQMVWMTAAHKLAPGLDWSPATEWSVNVDAAGKCHLTTAPSSTRTSTAPRPGPSIPPGTKELKCSTPAQKGYPIPITGRAPAVSGHRAFWGGYHTFRGEPNLYLVWQYARNGWAEMTLPFILHNRAKQAATLRDAVKIASQLRYGAATPPLLFPVQLTNLPSRWQVASVTYEPYGKVLRARSYSLGAGPPDLGFDGGLQYETGLPYFTIDPATRRTNDCYADPHHSAKEVIKGYRVVVTDNRIPNRHDLCAGYAHGLSLYISQFGAHPAISVAEIFGHYMRLLGRNPANWTSKPIG
jgi:hypothetical protein